VKMVIQMLIGLFGGLGMFLYGMKRCSDGLQKMAAHKLKQMIKVLTKSPPRGILVGVLVTMALQSSSATCIIVVGFVSAGLMNLKQSLGILLGSALGSSLTVQLIAFKITYLALLLIFVGAMVYLFAKRSQKRSIGQILLGFGLIFYGMFVMSSAMVPIKEFPAIANIIVGFEDYPIFAMLVSVAFTALIQSSAGFLALVMTLAGQGLIGVYAIIPFVLGAHIGGTITGVISSLGAHGRDSNRTAFANFFFKVVNGIIFLPMYRPLTRLILTNSSDINRGIANAHTFFSIVMAVGFLPFISQIAKLMTFLVPEKQDNLEEARFLKDDLREVPEVALDQAHLQTVEMGRIISDKMVKHFITSLALQNDETLDEISATEKIVDSYYRKISQYVTSLNTNSFSEDLLLRSIQILYIANCLELIGDLLVNIVQIAKKIRMQGVAFSKEGFDEIKLLYDMTAANLNNSIAAFEKFDQNEANLIIKEHPKIIRFARELQFNHFQRMQSGNLNTAATSSIHLDLMEALIRIDNQSVNIAQIVLGII
jgi:phosphate:Na+ symporter